MSIATQISRLLKIPTRLKNVTSAYLISLMRDTGRRSLTAAAKLSGLSISQFSRLLSGHKELALENLNRLSKRRLKKLVGKRRQLLAGAPWKVALIIDATLHQRSSRHLENSQRFNHGDGWVIGHQWTNMVLVINNETIPLPPLPFMTKKFSLFRGLVYKTEHERILDFLSKWDWESLLPGVSASEIVVLMDSGYDNKELETFIQAQGWSFVVSLKKSRAVQTPTQGLLQSVESLFQKTRKIGLWQTIRMNGGKKRKEFRARILTGFLKGVPLQVELVCSEKPNGERLFLACSREGTSLGAILRTYKLRWKVEIFHKEVKSYLGFEEAGLTSFDAMESHIYWVYCAYLLLLEINEQGMSTLTRRSHVENRLQNEDVGRILKLNSRFDSKLAVEHHFLQVRQKLKVG